MRLRAFELRAQFRFYRKINLNHADLTTRFFFVVCAMTRSHINNVEIFVEFCNYVLAELSHTFCMSSNLYKPP